MQRAFRVCATLFFSGLAWLAGQGAAQAHTLGDLVEAKDAVRFVHSLSSIDPSILSRQRTVWWERSVPNRALQIRAISITE